MRFDVDTTSATRIYAQLIAQFKRALATGTLRAGDAMPSLREMATNLRVNPLTVARAYRELEQSGLITTEHGKGSYINSQALQHTEQFRRETFMNAVDLLIEEAHRLGVSTTEMQQIIAERAKINKKETDENE